MSLFRWGSLCGAVLVLIVASLIGCGSAGPAFIGTWHTDLTPIKNNDVQKFFAPTLKFSVKFAEDGTLVSSWSADGKEKSRSGSWELLDGDGLRWQLMIKFPPPEVDQLEVRLVLRSNRGLAIESLEGFRDEGGAVEFKRP